MSGTVQYSTVHVAWCQVSFIFVILLDFIICDMGEVP